jgi:hypothetical protein
MLLRARQAVLTGGSDGGSPVKITATRICCISIVQINRIRTSPSYSAVESKCFGFSVKDFSPSAPSLVEINFFHRDRNALLASLPTGKV